MGGGAGALSFAVVFVFDVRILLGLCFSGSSVVRILWGLCFAAVLVFVVVFLGPMYAMHLVLFVFCRVYVLLWF